VGNLTQQVLAVKKVTRQELLRVAHTDARLTKAVEAFLRGRFSKEIFQDVRVSGLVELMLELDELVKKTLH